MVAGSSERQKQGHRSSIYLPGRVVEVPQHLVKKLQLLGAESELFGHVLGIFEWM